MKNFDIRAVSIDLARQIETLEMVKKTFDVCADAGMNMVLLYIEDRIKTESYPYSADKESYSEDEIRELVAYADQRGLELVPLVSPIGHTDRFLRHPQLKHLAELYEKLPGAFNEAGEEVYLTTCPSRKETLEFFDMYITEVAQLFPGRYFHLGFDEIWDMGFCEVCKTKKLEDLFLDAVVHFHELLKKLGKETIIADDMIEEFPWIIDRLPKDIILGTWFYEYVGRYPAARFSTGRSFDIFKLYEEKGFRYFAWTWHRGSIDSLTRYTAKGNSMGMLLSSWELSNHQQTPFLYPLISYAGALWSGKEEPGMDAAIRAARKYTEDEQSAVTLATLMTSVTFRPYPLPGNGNAYHIPSDDTYYTATSIPMMDDAVNNMEGDEDVLTAFKVRWNHYKLRYHLWQTGYELHEHRTGEGTWSFAYIESQTALCEREAEEFEKTALELWDRLRPGFDSPDLIGEIKNAKKAVSFLKNSITEVHNEKKGRLVVRYHLPEPTTACITEIVLHYAEGEDYKVARGNFKSIPVPYFKENYDISYEIPADREPTAVTLSVSGYGGSGFRYVSATLPGRNHLIPDGITDVRGQVEHPEFILYDDSRSAMFNEQEMLQYFASDLSTHRQHSVTISLKK